MDLWGSNYIILGGWVVGLNSDFNTIPIFFLSFLKISAIFLRVLWVFRGVSLREES